MANGPDAEFSMEWKGYVPEVSTTTTTTPAPGLATNVYVSKILVVGLIGSRVVGDPKIIQVCYW